jgi:hypothetical protein
MRSYMHLKPKIVVEASYLFIFPRILSSLMNTENFYVDITLVWYPYLGEI